MAPEAGPSADRRARRPRRGATRSHAFFDPLQNSPLGDLLSASTRAAWDPYRDLPWQTEVRWRDVELPDRSCLVSHFSRYRAMTAAQRQEAKCAEMAAHLSSLADGEERAARLAAATAQLGPPPDHVWFLASLMADEAKHYAALVHYLQTKLRLSYQPTPVLSRVFQALEEQRSFELNVVAGQLVLEATASALLASLLTTVHEPLLHLLLRRIMRDEARHMTYARGLAPSVREPRVLQTHAARDLLFEAAFAGASSLMAVRAWEEIGLSAKEARHEAVEVLDQRGFLAFYEKVIVEQLARQGYDADTLRATLGRRLERRLRDPP